MSKQSIIERISTLRTLLEKYNHHYYHLDECLVSDQEFDALLAELENLEQDHPEFQDSSSPTQRVGAQHLENHFSTVKHRYKMYSLSNTYSKEELKDWQKRLHKHINSEITYNCELKYDGASISIWYENGKLSKAITRGDGLQGDDVTLNVKTIKDVPKQLQGNNYPNLLEIRAEIVLPIADFNQMNQERQTQGLPLYANPRNTASGSLKLKDPKQTAKRALSCLVYAVIIPSEKQRNLDQDKPVILNQNEQLQKASQWGFNIPNHHILANSLQEVHKYIDYWDKERKSLPYETDGIVIKINDAEQQRILGYTSKAPKWAVAYKFKAEKVLTVLESVSYQVGRTGAITPVANLKAVSVSGSIVKRASLHNEDQIQQLDLYLKDHVYLEKGGEIIPKITAVDISRRLDNAQKVEFIENCPDCNTPLVKQEDQAQHYCPNEIKCPAQQLGKIDHFISRKALDIDGLGTETLQLLLKEGLIVDASDLYQLKYEQLISLDRMAQKSITNLLEAIEKSKSIPFERVLFGIGIRFVGETVSQNLAQHYKSIEALKNTDFETLINIDDIGKRIAASVLSYFSDQNNLCFLDKLVKAGLQFKVIEDNSKKFSNALLKGSTFVVTGSFSSISRENLKKLIKDHSGKVTTSLSSKTNYLIAGEKAGDSKLSKAKKLEIPILSEKTFFEQFITLE